MADICYLVQEEDGLSLYTLEEADGSLLLEICVPVTPGTPTDGVIVFVRRGDIEDGLRSGIILKPQTGRTDAPVRGDIVRPAPAVPVAPRGGAILEPQTGRARATVQGSIVKPRFAGDPRAGRIVKPQTGRAGAPIRGRILRPRTGGVD